MQINLCRQCMEDMGNSTVCPSCGFDPEKQAAVPHALRPNTILHGKYLVGNVLGQGGFGITYIGFDLTLELKVAIKEYYPSGAVMRDHYRSNALLWTRSEVLDNRWRNGCVQFLSEARKMARINSIPEIVSVRDTFEENNTAYIVMDYVPGTTMKSYVQKNGCLTFEDCVTLLSPVIEGMDKVHRQGLIHRDISPDNLMITPEGKVYLLDLGAAKDMKDRSGKDTSVVKWGFSPLEQYAASGTVGAWTDVYALAASIYYCVYGKTIPSAIERFDDDKLSFAGNTKKPLTAAQIAVLKKALAVNQEFRYQTAMELLIALRDSMKAPKKKHGKLIAAIAGAAAAAAAAALLVVTKPWLPSVVEYGSNGPYIDSSFVIIENEYEYFTDLDNALLRVPYHEEDQVFYTDTAEVILAQDDALEGDGVGGLNLAEDKLYGVYYGGTDSDGTEHSGYLFSMNHDGTGQRELQEIEHDISNPQYVKLSNGDEFLYYLMDDGTEEDAYHLHLYRYNIQDQKLERPITGEVEWYGVYGKYLYYTIWDEANQEYLLYRATLAGKSSQLIDDVHNYWQGVVVNDSLYLIQITSASGEYSIGLVRCDDMGQPVEEGKGIFGIDWNDLDWTVGGGWIYYSEGDSDELYRIRLDGTEKSLIQKGYQYEDLSYCLNQLYFQDGTMEDDEFQPLQSFIAADDGSWIVQCEARATTLTDEQGVQYVIEDGYAKAVGYVGTSEHVILPLEFNGYPFDDSVNWEEFNSTQVALEDLHFYALMDESELTYTRNADGITITDYSGVVTGAFGKVAIPSEIDGTPVVAIGEEAFAECTFSRVYLPMNLTEIGESAFTDCNNLIGVIFPDTLKTIRSYAFYKCSFKGADIVFPEGVETLEHGILQGCSPASVYIPASLENFQDGFLIACRGEYIVAPDHEWLKSENGIVFNKTGKTLYAFPCERSGSYTVPASVTRIDEYAFYASRLSQITLPEGLKEIGKRAFKWCDKLTNINIPRSVTSIGEEAFFNTALKTVTIAKNTEGKDKAFDSNIKVNYYA